MHTYVTYVSVCAHVLHCFPLIIETSPLAIIIIADGSTVPFKAPLRSDNSSNNASEAFDISTQFRISNLSGLFVLPCNHEIN